MEESKINIGVTTRDLLQIVDDEGVSGNVQSEEGRRRDA